MLEVGKFIQRLFLKILTLVKRSEIDLIFSNEEKTALVIDAKDNVGIALTELKQGDDVSVRFTNKIEKIKVIDNIAFGHKFVLFPLDKDEIVYKYGEEIGKMKMSVQTGGWIHNHNMYCERGMKKNE